MGGVTIPGLQVNGMNVLAVKQAMADVREFCSSGKGPIFVEMDTYRYHGHSMSDPGTTYRTRDEVGGVRNSKDPIDYVKKLLVDTKLATQDEVKAVEKEVRNMVQDALVAAKKGSLPPTENLWTDIYANASTMKNEFPPFVRMPDYAKSIKH
jgi:pyruvate dehydrogenase E1 component alpha subunit